jgi:hypothetical protein
MSGIPLSDCLRWPGDLQLIEKGSESSWSQALHELHVADGMATPAALDELSSAYVVQASVSVGLSDARLAWNQSLNTSAVTADIENALEWLQGEQVKLIKTDVIREYMRLHSDMVSAVDIIASLVRNRFGTDVELLLDVYDDPEIDDEYLRLRIRTTDYNSEFMNLIDTVDELVGPIVQHATGRLLLTTDFMPGS